MESDGKKEIKEKSLVTNQEAVAIYNDKDKLIAVRPISDKVRQRMAAFVLALQKTTGNVYQASVLTGISADCHYDWKLKHARYRELLDKLNEFRLDFVESQALKRIGEGSDYMISKWLDAHGSARGWGKNKEMADLAIPVFVKEVIERPVENTPLPAPVNTGVETPPSE